MKKVLMVAFQFPPFAGSSAVQRTLRFVRYLPEFGWQPIVLTAMVKAYEQTGDDQVQDIPPDTPVVRAFCLDAARHLGVSRRYPAWFARPDRWISWLPGGIFKGLGLIRRHAPDVIWSTFPIPTAHLIAKGLHTRSGLPWVADFRDPMVQPNDPDDPVLWRAVQKVEETTMAHSQLNVFTTGGTRDLYRARYPQRLAEDFAVVENGYDEEVFAAVERSVQAPDRDADGRLLLLHSGAIYPLERDPTEFFRALRELLDRNVIGRRDLCVRLRATGHDADIARMVAATGVAEVVEFAPPIAYRAAIAEMLRADGLLILQASQVRTQVPAKVYEYLRAERPILALTDPDSDTARVLESAGVRHIARIDSARSIAPVLEGYLTGLRSRSVQSPDPAVVRMASRRLRAGELASLLAKTVAASAR